MPAPILEARNITKRYPGVVALDHLSLALQPGTIHALVGENGAGKSTLIKILAGVIAQDEGEIRIGDVPTGITNPVRARELGIGVVHQHTHLIPDLSVAENHALRLGYPFRRGTGVDWGEMRTRARDGVSALIPALDVARTARTLSGVEQQLVELSFALASSPRILILDEPTAVLPHSETAQLFRRVREFAARGGSVLFISHRLDEVFEIAADVTVVRDGRFIWRKNAGETDHDDLIQAMVGRVVEFDQDETCIPSEDTVFRVNGLTDGEGSFEDVSFSIRRGEILGIYGLVGSGQSEMCQALFGLRSATGREEVMISDARLEGQTPRQRARAGMSYVPAERMQQGLFYQMTVGENLSLAALPSLAARGIIKSEVERRSNAESIKDLHIRTLGQHQAVAHLSGGNQQKVLLGRWLQTDPGVLILQEPTQGVDVGAKGEIHKIITGLARSGVSILLISSEIPELHALCHRIGIMRQGRLVDVLDGATSSEEEILRLALPESRTESECPADGKAASQGKGRSVFGWLMSRREASIGLFVAALALAFSFAVPAFASWRNISDILVNNAILLVGALGMTLVIISGGIDISVGAILGLAAVAAGKADLAGLPAPAIGLFAVLVGLLLGLANGLLAVFGRVHSIVITLGTMSIFRGAIIQWTGGRWLLNLSGHVTLFGQSKPMGVPVLLSIALVVALAVHFFLRHVPAGRRLYALGGDRESAGVLGIYPKHVAPMAFGICGLLMGLAGLMQAGRYGQVQTNAGLGFELKVIAAAVIGGTHIMGGRGSALGTFLGAVLIGLITNVLVLSRVSAFWEGVVVGALILLALGADVLVTRKGGSGS